MPAFPNTWTIDPLGKHHHKLRPLDLLYRFSVSFLEVGAFDWTGLAVLNNNPRNNGETIDISLSLAYDCPLLFLHQTLPSSARLHYRHRRIRRLVVIRKPPGHLRSEVSRSQSGQLRCARHSTRSSSAKLVQSALDHRRSRVARIVQAGKDCYRQNCPMCGHHHRRPRSTNLAGRLL